MTRTRIPIRATSNAANVPGWVRFRPASVGARIQEPGGLGKAKVGTRHGRLSPFASARMESVSHAVTDPQILLAPGFWILAPDSPKTFPALRSCR
jgi:hypothetical protein